MTYQEKLIAGLQLMGCSHVPQRSGKYQAYQRLGSKSLYLVGKAGALRTGSCASNSTSLGDPTNQTAIWKMLADAGERGELRRCIGCAHYTTQQPAGYAASEQDKAFQRHDYCSKLAQAVRAGEFRCGGDEFRPRPMAGQSVSDSKTETGHNPVGNSVPPTQSPR